MGHFTGRVSEIRTDTDRHIEMRIACSAGAVPQAGQYVLASSPHDHQAALGAALFLVEVMPGGFWAVASTPTGWDPGTDLRLTGPLGHGFVLSPGLRRLGLVALGETIARLSPLIRHPATSQAAMTLFTELPLPALPSSLEVSPLASLADALDWPDFFSD